MLTVRKAVDVRCCRGMSRPSAYRPGTDLQQEERRGLCSAPGCSRLLWEGAGLLTLVQGLLALAELLCVRHCLPLASLPVLCRTGPGSNSCLICPVIRGVAAAAAPGCRWGNVLLSLWRGARGDILVPPPLPPKGAGRPVPGGCFGRFLEWCIVCIGLACVYLISSEEKKKSFFILYSIFILA